MAEYETHICTHFYQGHDCHCEIGQDHTWEEYKKYETSREAYYGESRAVAQSTANTTG